MEAVKRRAIRLVFSFALLGAGGARAEAIERPSGRLPPTWGSGTEILEETGETPAAEQSADVTPEGNTPKQTSAPEPPIAPVAPSASVTPPESNPLPAPPVERPLGADTAPAPAVSRAPVLARTVRRTPKIVIGIERLFGAYAWNASVAVGGAETKANGAMVNGLLSNTATNAPGGLINPFAAPRLGADWISPLGITAGLGVGFLAASGESVDKTPEAETKAPFPSGTAFLVAPRAGWFGVLNRWLTLWPRAGVTYVRINDSLDTGTTRFQLLALSLEPAVALTPIAHVAILVGPSLDIPLTGSGFTDQASGRRDLSTRFSNYGGSVGAAIAF